MGAADRRRIGGVVSGSDTGAAPGARVWRMAGADPAVRAALGAATLVRTLEVVDEVGSTQDLARRMAADGAPAGTLVLAERQTAGRGRVGRGWDDDPRPGASLAGTLLLGGDAVAPLVPHAIGLGVRDAVAPWLGDRARLKWPNDVVVRVDDTPRKVAGLLVEREEAGRVGGGPVLLAGVGLNVDRRHLPPASDRAGVADLAGRDVAAAALLAGLVTGLDGALRLLADGPAALLGRYREASDTRGRDVDVVLPDGARLRGTADVDDEGRLVVTSSLGRHTVLAGTVRDADAADAGAATSGA